MAALLATTLDFVSCVSSDGLRAAYFGRALKAANGATGSPDSFVRTLVTGFAALWIVPPLFFNEAPGPATNDMTLQCLLAAWVLYFFPVILPFRDVQGTFFVHALSVLFESMFVAHLIVTFTHKGASASASIICPLITGTLAGCSTQLLEKGFAAYRDLLTPASAVGLSFFGTVFVLVTGPKRSLWFPVSELASLPVYTIPPQHQTLLLLSVFFAASYFRGEGPATVGALGSPKKRTAAPKSPKGTPKSGSKSPKSPKRSPSSKR